MRKFRLMLTVGLFVVAGNGYAQSNDSLVIAAIMKEANENSQLQKLGHELMDVIGPRLVGSPQMQQAHEWAVAKYKTWDIAARNEKWANGADGKEEFRTSTWFIRV